jgi:hypothetical protein
MIKNRFELEGTVDQVRFGTLYRAVDTASPAGESDLALWVLPAHVGRQRATLLALSRDFARVRTLNHPNIGGVYALDQDETTYFVLLEWIDGETLRNVLDSLKPERLDRAEADAIVRTVGLALAYAHDQNVAHGEVRAENIVVTMDKSFKLVNFMARSVMKAAPGPARRSDDVRDLALLAYELYTGEPLPRSGRLSRGRHLPRARAKAIKAALDAHRRDFDVRQFLRLAALDTEPLPPAPRPTEVKHAGRARSPLWRTALPALAILLVGGVIMQSKVASGWLDDVAALQRTGAAALRERRAASTPAAVEPAAESVAKQRDATSAGDPVAGGWPEPEPAAAPDATPAAEPERSLAVPVMLRARPAPPPPPANDAPQETAARDKSAARMPVIVSFTVPTVTAHEGQSAAAIDIVRSGDRDKTAEFVWWTSDGTAHARDDYAGFSKRVERLQPGETARRLYIPIASDAVPEPDKYFEVHIEARPSSARVGQIGTVRVNIIDDDL